MNSASVFSAKPKPRFPPVITPSQNRAVTKLSCNVRTDLSPEFTCRALDQSAYEHALTLRLNQSGKTIQNGFSDSVHIRKMIKDWRQDNNVCRPHSALDFQTLSEFVVGWRNGECESKHTTMSNWRLCLIPRAGITFMLALKTVC